MRRAALIAEGWGLPGAFGLALPGVGALVLLVAGRRRAAAFGALAWACALVPFAFSDAVPYRAYPSIAPTALLAGGGLVALASGLRLGPSAALRRGAAAATVAVLAVAGSRGVRGQRLELWREAVSEVEACRAPLAALARAHPESPPVCANLETTTIGLLLYLWPGTTEADLTDLGFLDAASGYVAPSQSPPGPWFGRRCEGSYGVIDPEPYFRERPELAPWRLHARARPVRSLRDALRRMADGSVDLAREALVEAPPEAVRALADAPEDDAGELRVLEELALDAVRPGASMRVLVRAPRPVLLVVQAGFLYQPLYRIAPDQALFSDVRERRVIRLRARSNGTDLPTFAANGFGSAVLVPSGEHSVELDWSIARPEELR
jgi:hypothetical protein